MVKTDGQGLEVPDPFMPDGRLPLIGAYCFPTGADTEFVASFNHGLRDLHASGDWQQLVAPFGFTESNAPPADLTTEKACAGG
jgi:polar amino acid transport system substrate-binding protein